MRERDRSRRSTALWLAACAVCAGACAGQSTAKTPTPPLGPQVQPLPTPPPVRVEAPSADQIVADNQLPCPQNTRRLLRMIPDPNTDEPTLREEGACLLEDGTLHGPYRRGREDGTPIDIGNFDHGLRVGHWRIGIDRWSGYAWHEENYVNGLLDGPYDVYWSNGLLTSTGQYSGGKRVGRWRFYNIINGVLTKVAEGDFVDDQQHGAWVYTNDMFEGTRTIHWRHGKRTD